MAFDAAEPGVEAVPTWRASYPRNRIHSAAALAAAGHTLGDARAALNAFSPRLEAFVADSYAISAYGVPLETTARTPSRSVGSRTGRNHCNGEIGRVAVKSGVVVTPFVWLMRGLLWLLGLWSSWGVVCLVSCCVAFRPSKEGCAKEGCGWSWGAGDDTIRYGA